jgi:hypothetical protein
VDITNVDKILDETQKTLTNIIDIKSKLRGNRRFIPDIGFNIDNADAILAQRQLLVAQDRENPESFSIAAGMVKDSLEATAIMREIITGYLDGKNIELKDDILKNHKDIYEALIGIAESIKSMSPEDRIELVQSDMFEFFKVKFSLTHIERTEEPMKIVDLIQSIKNRIENSIIAQAELEREKHLLENKHPDPVKIDLKDYRIKIEKWKHEFWEKNEKRGNVDDYEEKGLEELSYWLLAEKKVHSALIDVVEGKEISNYE